MKKAKVFKNGPNREDSEVFIMKSGNRAPLIPRSNSWNSFFASLDKFSADFMVERTQPEMQRREDL